MFRKSFSKLNIVFSIPKRYGSLLLNQENNANLMRDTEPPKESSVLPAPRYGGEHIVTLLTGSEVGNAGSSYIQTIFDYVHTPIMFEKLCTENCGDVTQSSQDEILMSVMRNSVAINIDVQHEIQRKTESMMMNNELDLYACVVNCLSFPGFKAKFKNLDIAIVTQNNTGDFSKLEYEPVKGIVKTMKMCRDDHLRKFMNFAFSYATKTNRKKITFAHKKKEIPISDGRFLKIAKEVQQSKYRHIEFEEMPVNRIVRNLIQKPQMFDVICSNEKYGTFITAVCSAICGRPSLFCAIEVGDNHAVFKPLETKLSLTSTLEKPLCPYGTISAGVQLLLHLNYCHCASIIWNALVKTMIVDKIKTKEFGGSNSENDVICRIIENLGVEKCTLNQNK